MGYRFKKEQLQYIFYKQVLIEPTIEAEAPLREVISFPDFK